MILTGIPNTGIVPTDFCMNFVRMVAYSFAHSLGIALVDEKNSIIQEGRHKLASIAVAKKTDKLFFIDTDMTFPPEVLVELNRHDKDIVGCNYVRRVPPFNSTCKTSDLKEYPYSTKGVQKTGYLGTGCILIKTKVFEELGKPYFRVKYNKKEDVFKGEDYCFCEQARRAGFDVFCDFDLSKKIGHISQRVNMWRPENE